MFGVGKWWSCWIKRHDCAGVFRHVYLEIHTELTRDREEQVAALLKDDANFPMFC